MQSRIVEILLVEDNPQDAEMTIRTLKKNNISNNIVHLEDGEQAIDYLFCKGIYSERHITDFPKVVLLDIKMPKVSGIEVLRQIRENSITKSLPVVILTSSREDPDIKACYDLGVNSYIVKPVEFDDFSKTVNKLGLYWLLLNQSPI